MTFCPENMVIFDRKLFEILKKSLQLHFRSESQFTTVFNFVVVKYLPEELNDKNNIFISKFQIRSYFSKSSRSKIKKVRSMGSMNFIFSVKNDDFQSKYGQNFFTVFSKILRVTLTMLSDCIMNLYKYLSNAKV